MSFNSSSSSNASLSSSATCFNDRSIFFIFTAFSVTEILLLLPLCLFVLYLGLQRWQKQRSASMAATVTHSDIFTYHMVAMEMIGVLGCGFYCCGACFNVPLLMSMGMYLFSVTSNGQIFFHILTCVERHLAVVHPITYLNLRNRGGVTIRNITIGCVWLLFLASFGLTTLSFSTVPAFCLSVLSVLIISFCSLSVLCALIRPGPGDGGKGRDQSKMRAFHTIMAIMGVLLFRLGGHLLVLAVYSSLTVSERVRCGVLVSGVWFCLPSSLVLPLLFLHRGGKLLCCKKTDQDKDQSRTS